MLNWIEISSHDDIPGRDENGRQRNFLAIHHTTNYTSDVYMVWKNKDGEVPRWPHTSKSITHIAEYNLPNSVGEGYDPRLRLLNRESTYQDFEDQIDVRWVNLKNEDLMRKGQVVMNALAEVWPEKYKEVSGSVLDCFYNDSAVGSLKIHLSNQDWDEKKIHRPYQRTIREIVDRGRWDEVCDSKGMNRWALNEGKASYEDVLAFSILELNKLKLGASDY
jgi:hypothetical protein